MEERWPSLAVNAQSCGALDYSKITRRNPASLLKEHLVHKYLENKRNLEFKKAKILYTLCLQGQTNSNLIYDQNINREKDLFYKLILPWEYKPYRQLIGAQGKSAIEKFLESNEELNKKEKIT